MKPYLFKDTSDVHIYRRKSYGKKQNTVDDRAAGCETEATGSWILLDFVWKNIALAGKVHRWRHASAMVVVGKDLITSARELMLLIDQLINPNTFLSSSNESSHVYHVIKKKWKIKWPERVAFPSSRLCVLDDGKLRLLCTSNRES